MMNYDVAIKIVIDELKKEPGNPNGMYFAWQSNIAMTIVDNSNIDRETANTIAKRFLDRLIG